MYTLEFRKVHLRTILSAAVAAVLAAGCAHAPRNTGLQAVYCVNAPEAQLPPPHNLPPAYCTNLQQAAVKPETSLPETSSVHRPPRKPSPTRAALAKREREATESKAVGGAAGVAKPVTPPTAVQAPTAPTINNLLPQAFTFDLDRYMGRWYIIASVPYWAERGDVGSYAEYRNRGGGDLDDFYFSHPRNFDEPLQEKKGLAHVVEGSGGTRWRVTFFWPIYDDYQVLYVDPDYRYALAGNPDKSRGWVLARKPSIDNDTYHTLLAKLAALGYNTNKFKRVPQTPAQIGQPNFQ